jgi:cystathionine beta-lyase/cystathionine gamma-synthase
MHAEDDQVPITGSDRRSASTIVAHDGDFPFGAVVPPIYQTSLFTYANYAELADSFAGELTRPIYSRGDNPTVMEFEAKIAELEGAEAARGLASGMAAISAAVLSNVRAGDRIVCVRHVYPDAYRLFVKLLPRFDIRVDFVDGADPAAVERALPGARMLYLESPTSWVMETHDLPVLASMAREHGAVSVIDNSWATPVFQRPLDHGVDLVVHSASKYLSGHSDTVAGVVAGRGELIDRVNDLILPSLGAKLAPFEAWLLVRGLRTLPIRMAQHDLSGTSIARRLAEHRAVARVHHPALRGGVDGAVLRGASGLLSFEAGPAVDIPAFCDALSLFKIGVSWGGHESLVLPASAVLSQTGGPNSAVDFGVPPQMVRLHVGLEDVEDLWADLDQALSFATRE